MTAPARRAPARSDVPYVVPSWTDAVVERATGVIGGPTGRFAVVGGRGPAGVAVVLVLLGAVMLALGAWQKGHCLMKGWSTPSQFWRACYSDLPVVHVSSPLAEGQLPWAGDVPSNQPPLSGLVMWVIAQLSPSTGQGLAAQQWVFVLWTLAAVLLLAAAVPAAVGLQPGRPWQAAHLAVSPVLVTLALVSTDLLGIALTMLGLFAWRRDRAWVAGVLLGLALLVRPFPLVFLLAIVLVAWRRHHLLAAGRAVVGAVLGALAVVAPLLLVEPQALAGAQQWWGAPASYGALQMVPALHGITVPGGLTTAVAVAGWVGGTCLAAWFVSRPWRRVVAVHQVAALIMLVVVLTAPSLSVQSGLWLLPFLALSSRPWWEHLVWAFAETLHFVMTWMHLAFASDPGRGLPASTYSLVVVVRVAAWAWVLWRVAEERPPSAVTAPRGRPALLGR